MPLAITALDHLVINVADVSRTTAWYTRVLGMDARVSKRDGGTTPRAALHFGAQKINVRPVETDKAEWFTANHERAGSDDLCFLTDDAPDAVMKHLQECGVAIEVGPVPRDGAQGIMTSVYCRDPDGNLIEIASYRKASR